MFENTTAFSGFSVDDIDRAKNFYGQTLGVKIDDQPYGFSLLLAGGQRVFVYPKPDHQPATYTVLNFEVKDIDATVDELIAKGVVMEHYDGEMATDEKGVMRGAEKQMGPNIAWFKDPAGNILSVVEE